MTDVLMPRLSDSMQEGTILTWLAANGDDVVEGQELVEVETDKATMTHISESSGVLSIVIAEGTTVTVGDVIARVEPRGNRGCAGNRAGDRGSRSRARPDSEENAPIRCCKSSNRRPPATVQTSPRRRWRAGSRASTGSTSAR